MHLPIRLGKIHSCGKPRRTMQEGGENLCYLTRVTNSNSWGHEPQTLIFIPLHALEIWYLSPTRKEHTKHRELSSCSKRLRASRPLAFSHISENLSLGPTTFSLEDSSVFHKKCIQLSVFTHLGLIDPIFVVQKMDVIV